MAEIVVDIKRDGSAVIQPHGFAGEACRRATEGLERALGRVTHTEATPELYQAEVAQAQQIPQGLGGGPG